MLCVAEAENMCMAHRMGGADCNATIPRLADVSPSAFQYYGECKPKLMVKSVQYGANWLQRIAPHPKCGRSHLSPSRIFLLTPLQEIAFK